MASWCDRVVAWVHRLPRLRPQSERRHVSTQPVLDTGPSPAPPSPLPISVTDERESALDAAAQTPPATPQPTPNPAGTARTKPRRRSNSPAPNPCSRQGLNKPHCPRLSSNSRSGSSGNRWNSPSENASSIGRPVAGKVRAELHAVAARYKSQVCQEMRGGIPVSTVSDRSGDYVEARAAAQAFEERARAKAYLRAGSART